MKKISGREVKAMAGSHWSCNVRDAVDRNQYTLSGVTGIFYPDPAVETQPEIHQAPHLCFQDLHETGMGVRPWVIDRPLADSMRP